MQQDRREIRIVLLLMLMITVAGWAWLEYHKPVVALPVPAPQPRTRTELVDGRPIRVVTDLPYSYVPGVPPDELGMDLFIPDHHGNLPVLVYLHGGGWAGGNKNGIGPKSVFFASKDIIVASVNYRLGVMTASPNAADDVAAAIRYLRHIASGIGADANRIVLMGHSAGAHIGALVACDERYLARQGLSPDAIAGTILLDGSAYDIPTLMKDERGESFVGIFSRDPQLWKEVSPITYAQHRRGKSPFVLAYAGNDPVRRAAAIALDHAIEASGAGSIIISLPDLDHGSIDQSLTSDADPFTRFLLQFIRRERDTVAR